MDRKIYTIAIVTNEGKNKMCEKYWPECGCGKSYGPSDVSIVEQHHVHKITQSGPFN